MGDRAGARNCNYGCLFPSRDVAAWLLFPSPSSSLHVTGLIKFAWRILRVDMRWPSQRGLDQMAQSPGLTCLPANPWLSSWHQSAAPPLACSLLVGFSTVAIGAKSMAPATVAVKLTRGRADNAK